MFFLNTVHPASQVLPYREKGIPKKLLTVILLQVFCNNVLGQIEPPAQELLYEEVVGSNCDAIICGWDESDELTRSLQETEAQAFGLQWADETHPTKLNISDVLNHNPAKPSLDKPLYERRQMARVRFEQWREMLSAGYLPLFAHERIEYLSPDEKERARAEINTIRAKRMGEVAEQTKEIQHLLSVSMTEQIQTPHSLSRKGNPLRPQIVNVHLDHHKIIQGSPVTGYVEVNAIDGEEIILKNRISILSDGIAFFITSPNGEVVEISYQTYGTTSSSFLSGVTIPAREKLFFPLCLIIWDGDFIFKQIGAYSIDVRLTTSETSRPQVGHCTIRVVEGDGQLAKWREVLPSVSSLIAPFRFGLYEKMRKKASRISDLYPPLVDQMFVYNSGGFVIPEFFNDIECGRDVPEDKMEKVLGSYIQGRSLVQKTTFGEKMWDYIGIAIDKFSKGEAPPQGDESWIFR